MPAEVTAGAMADMVGMLVSAAVLLAAAFTALLRRSPPAEPIP